MLPLFKLLCEFQDAIEELPRLQKQIRDHVPLNIPNISESLRIALVYPPSLFTPLNFLHSVTEQPFKIPYYTALIRLLHDRPEDAADVDGPSLGRQILEDFWKGFQAYVDKLAWRETRLCVSHY